MQSFMLLFWAPKHLLAKPRSPDQARESGEKWHSWAQALNAAGCSVTGAQLEASGVCVTADKTVVAGTFGGDHVMGGYFMVSASNLVKATELNWVRRSSIGGTAKPIYVDFRGLVALPVKDYLLARRSGTTMRAASRRQWRARPPPRSIPPGGNRCLASCRRTSRLPRRSRVCAPLPRQ